MYLSFSNNFKRLYYFYVVKVLICCITAAHKYFLVPSRYISFCLSLIFLPSSHAFSFFLCFNNLFFISLLWFFICCSLPNHFFFSTLHPHSLVVNTLNVLLLSLALQSIVNLELPYDMPPNIPVFYFYPPLLTPRIHRSLYILHSSSSRSSLSSCFEHFPSENGIKHSITLHPCHTSQPSYPVRLDVLH